MGRSSEHVQGSAAEAGPATGRVVSRRSVLKYGLGAAGAGVLVVSQASPAVAAPAASGSRVCDAQEWRAAGQVTSANGWTIGPTATSVGARTVAVEGSDVTVAVRSGEVATVLLYVVRRFHYEIDSLRPGEVIGFTAADRFPTRHQSNHMSGTAVDIRPGWYPLGVSGEFSPIQITIIRDIIAVCDGVVRWGGDYRHSADEGHFQIDVPPGSAALSTAASKISGFAAAPGQGPGAGEALPFTEARRARADTVRARQGTPD